MLYRSIFYKLNDLICKKILKINLLYIFFIINNFHRNASAYQYKNKS